ncbi:uncharacterized protein F4822DRAFT_429991 [Hypoxylon trugodes]|uniref:uncharacterized protein n=1 Tax=Hypoxylon trugodes TaxID=326681 RepID=UPI00218CC72D|nr:uncharacterized protein F4822DRAFT_429991 [Hypoxylon trugodes]KAI1387237.1 hypothetical protein F4822DRAFT_429991 [Hypoxylon trugodes]
MGDMMENERNALGWVKVVIFAILIQASLIDGLSWRSAPRVDIDRAKDDKSTTTGGNLSQLLSHGARLPSSYEVALNELRELESEPLCHRTAARLLVNNCELLEGKNDATALTDSGRMIRDFVDSYAASLAICDLERGSFQIPRECAKFRESVLGQLPLQNLGHLHNTWVSYRHKALRFCEAARVDNEKAEHILLFQRLMKIMGRFSDDVDKQFDQRMNDLHSRAQATGGRIDELSPKVDQLKDSLKSIEELFLGQLVLAVKETTEVINSGTENAANLERMLGVLFKSVLEGQAKVASIHERSMQLASQRVETAANAAFEAIAVVTGSAVKLHSQVELSHLRAIELESRQENLELGMQRLVNVAENLTAKYDDHTNLLHQAQNITDELLDNLEDMAVSATYIGESILRRPSDSSWWPYIWCPAASLVLGSYGLPPSATRNIALLVRGEVLGYTISSIQSLYFGLSSSPTARISTLLFTWGRSSPTTSTTFNTTAQPGLS